MSRYSPCWSLEYSSVRAWICCDSAIFGFGRIIGVKGGLVAIVCLLDTCGDLLYALRSIKK